MGYHGILETCHTKDRTYFAFRTSSLLTTAIIFLFRVDKHGTGPTFLLTLPFSFVLLVYRLAFLYHRAASHYPYLVWVGQEQEQVSYSEQSSPIVFRIACLNKIVFYPQEPFSNRAAFALKERDKIERNWGALHSTKTIAFPLAQIRVRMTPLTPFFIPTGPRLSL